MLSSLIPSRIAARVKDALIDGQPGKRLQHDFHLSPGEMVFPKPPIP